jgi:hypothetical protein
MEKQSLRIGAILGKNLEESPIGDFPSKAILILFEKFL